jgi:hypothetical protein
MTSTIASIIDSMGDELKQYLQGCWGRCKDRQRKRDRRKKKARDSKDRRKRFTPSAYLSTYIMDSKRYSVHFGIRGLFDFSSGKEAASQLQLKQEKRREVQNTIRGRAGLTYKIYKKAHRFMTG